MSVEIERKAQKRLVIDVPEPLHREIKVRASALGIPLKTWILRAIAKRIIQEDDTRR